MRFDFELNVFRRKVEETRSRIPLVPSFVRFTGDAFFLPAKLEHGVSGEESHVPAQGRGVIPFETGKEFPECPAILEEVEDGAGQGIGGNAPTGGIIFKDEMFFEPIADDEGGTPIDRLRTDFVYFSRADYTSGVGCVVHRFRVGTSYQLQGF